MTVCQEKLAQYSWASIQSAVPYRDILFAFVLEIEVKFYLSLYPCFALSLDIIRYCMNVNTVDCERCIHFCLQSGE